MASPTWFCGRLAMITAPAIGKPHQAIAQPSPSQSTPWWPTNACANKPTRLSTHTTHAATAKAYRPRPVMRPLSSENVPETSPFVTLTVSGSPELSRFGAHRQPRRLARRGDHRRARGVSARYRHGGDAVSQDTAQHRGGDRRHCRVRAHTELLYGEQAEHHRCQSARAEPADEQCRAPTQ